jgi:hypothetical protein
MKLTEPPFATTSTMISLSAWRIRGDAFKGAILISGMTG